MAQLLISPRFRAFDDTGAPLAGGKLYSYAAGTTTPKDTYSNSTGNVNTNPVQLDGSGYGDVWLGSGAYKFILADVNDVPLWTIDNVKTPDTGEFSALSVTGASTVAAVSASGQITSTVTTGTAPLVVASTTKVANLNADQLDSADWAAPLAIGSTTPAAGSFTALSASGNLAVTGTSVLTGAATVTGVLTTATSSVKNGANGEQAIQGYNSEEITLSTVGATSDSVANLLPANSVIDAVVVRITQAITTATDWKVGDATQAARFAIANVTLALGTTAVCMAHLDPTVASANLGPVQSAAAKVRITTTGTPGAGKIRVTVFYRQYVAPTA